MEIPCFVVGDTDVFHVVVNPGKWVSYLKEEIKKKQEPKLNNAAAPDLTLYRVEIEDQVEKSITEQGFIDHLNQLSQNKNKNDALPGRHKVSLYFDNPPEGKSYYVLVQPPQGESTYCRGVVLMADVVATRRSTLETMLISHRDASW